MESLVIFKLYTGLKFLFVLTLAAFVYLLVTEKNRNFRILSMGPVPFLRSTEGSDLL